MEKEKKKKELTKARIQKRKKLGLLYKGFKPRAEIPSILLLDSKSQPMELLVQGILPSVDRGIDVLENEVVSCYP